MRYDFDTIIDRRGTNSLKYDFAVERGKGEDVLPLWVADMDFQTAPEILDRLEKTVKHGIFGYSEGKGEYFQALAGWYQKNFGWEVKPDWLVKTPGIVFALAAAIQAFTREGESILIQQPVYYPFTEVIEDNRRVLVNNPLELVDGHYQIDFEDFERKITEHQVKLFLLCSPHNPVGRVWQEWELRKMADICLKHGVLIASDEIHNDFTWPGHKHFVLADLAPEYADITITCTAPTKTFNLAGLQISNILISNRELKTKFELVIAAAGYSQVNLMGLVACQTAYEEGADWLRQLKEYLKDNLDYVREYLNLKLPEIKLIEPEGTYLIWLDCRGLNMTEQEREELIVKKARLWLDSGAIFGEAGEGFERINIACPRVVLEDALSRLEKAIHKSAFTREDAWALLNKYNKEPFHIQHAECVEGIMRYFAKQLGYEDEQELWGIVGLLHDLDFEQYPQEHCIKSQELMREAGVDERIIRATASHGYGITVDIKPEHEMEKVLYAVDELSGLIGAVVLMRPSKSVQDLEVKSVKKKYKTPKFAAGCSREVIDRGAEMLGWSLDELIQKTIDAMRTFQD